MNKIVWGLVTTFALAASAFAQEAARADDTFVNSQTTDQYLARDNLIGAKVHGSDGTIIGDIEDLIINDTNQVVGVVMGTGGFVGLGEKKVGVTLSALKFSEENGKTTISLPQATKAALEAVEPYKRTQPRKSLLERAQEKVKELTDKTTATTEDAYEKAKPVIEKAKETAKEAYDKAKDAVDTAKEVTKEAIAPDTPAPDETAPAAPAPSETTAPAEPAPSEAAAPSEPEPVASPPAETTAPESTPSEAAAPAQPEPAASSEPTATDPPSDTPAAEPAAPTDSTPSEDTSTQDASPPE